MSRQRKHFKVHKESGEISEGAVLHFLIDLAVLFVGKKSISVVTAAVIIHDESGEPLRVR
jgi:hypothetical protein